MNTTTKIIINASHREELINKTNAIKAQRPDDHSINEFLIIFYKKPKEKEFKSLYQWQNEGFELKSENEQPFFVWGKPIESSKIKGQKWCPLVPLFSNLQVKKVKGGKK